MKKFLRIHVIAIVLLAVKPHTVLVVVGYAADIFTVAEHALAMTK